MDQFDFDDLEDQGLKKPINKKQSHKKISNNKTDDYFFDLQQQINSKQKQKQSKILKNDYEGSDDSDSDNKKQKKNKQKQKQNDSILPKINLPKSPKNNDHNDSTTKKNKMDLSLQYLPEKKVLSKQNQMKDKRRKYSQQSNDDFAVHKEKVEKEIFKQELKTNIIPSKQKNQPFKQIDKNVIKQSQQKIIPKQQRTHQVVQMKPTAQKKNYQQQQEQLNYDQDYEQQYEEEIADDQITAQQNINKNAQKKYEEKQKKLEKKSPVLNNKQKQIKDPKPISSSRMQKPQQDQKINKYKQLVEKSFPDDQDQQKIQKLKPDAINRLNQKMREMIKGFSNQLSNMIDKNLTLLRKPQNQIKEQIEGQTDPVQNQINLLQEMKKNNLKMIENSQKQLQNIIKTNEKISTSAKSNAQLTSQIQEHKKQIIIISKEIASLENDIEKYGIKVTKIEQNNNKQGVSQEFKDSRFKNVLQITQKIANQKLQFDKNKKKIAQLKNKLSELEQKVTETTQKRKKVLQKAQNEGISFHTKEQKKKYDDLKKKRDQYQQFELKFNSSIKSKEAVIQHEMTDYEVVIAEFERKYEILNEQVEKSQEKIFFQIRQAKKNPRLHSNTKEILTQLQMFMSDENPSRIEDEQNSLNLISQKIYKKEYQGKIHSKTLTNEKINKKPEYKNYLQQVTKQNEQARKKSTTGRKISEQNPFRKAVTPNESVQARKTQQKISRSKQLQQLQSQKQKQRIWKSSNTEVLIRNPLKKQQQNEEKSRYGERVQQENPLQNKEIIKLLNQNKEKIQLKDEGKSLSKVNNKEQEPINMNRRPFGMRTGIKQQNEQLNELADISKQMEKIGKEIESHRSTLKRESKMEMNEERTNGLQVAMDLKPAANTTPFRNLRLKKDKDNQKEKETSQTQSTKKIPIEQKSPHHHSNQLTNQTTPLTQESSSFKPKRFNPRRKNQNEGQSYIPSSRNVQNTSAINQKGQNRANPSTSLQQNYINKKNEIHVQHKQKQEAFDPFKKFMTNQMKDEKTISLNVDMRKEPLRLDDDNTIGESNNKPRMNLFKKGAGENDKDKKLALVGDGNREQQTNNQKVLNPYAQLNSQKQSQFPKVQRQGKLNKRMNPPANNLIKPNNKNIFADVEDATISANIKVLGDPQPVKKQSEPYVPKFINNDKELNVNDLLGIKKKNFQVDKELLIDLPGNNKVSIKTKARGKGGDFFGDMDL